MVAYLSTEEITAAANHSRIGWAPDDVIQHGVAELIHATEQRLMSTEAWLAQEGLCRR